MYNEYFNFSQQGWQCPICHKIFSPFQNECPYCNAQHKIVDAPKTNITSFDDRGWWDTYTKLTSADGQINIGPEGSTTWVGTPPAVYLNNIPWRDWLDVKTNVWED